MIWIKSSDGNWWKRSIDKQDKVKQLKMKGGKRMEIYLLDCFSHVGVSFVFLLWRGSTLDVAPTPARDDRNFGSRKDERRRCFLGKGVSAIGDDDRLIPPRRITAGAMHLVTGVPSLPMTMAIHAGLLFCWVDALLLIVMGVVLLLLLVLWWWPVRRRWWLFVLLLLLLLFDGKGKYWRNLNEEEEEVLGMVMSGNQVWGEKKENP